MVRQQLPYRRPSLIDFPISLIINPIAIARLGGREGGWVGQALIEQPRAQFFQAIKGFVGWRKYREHFLVGLGGNEVVVAIAVGGGWRETVVF